MSRPNNLSRPWFVVDQRNRLFVIFFASFLLATATEGYELIKHLGEKPPTPWEELKNFMSDNNAFGPSNEEASSPTDYVLRMLAATRLFVVVVLILAVLGLLSGGRLGCTLRVESAPSEEKEENVDEKEPALLPRPNVSPDGAAGTVRDNRDLDSAGAAVHIDRPSGSADDQILNPPGE